MEVRKKLKTVGTMLIAMIFISHFTYAQDRWSFELRPSVDFPTKKLGDIELNTGFGVEGTFAYRFMPHLAAYAGWSWNKFGSDTNYNGTDLDFEETGYTYGLQFIHPIGNKKINLLARAGGMVNHIEVEQGGEIVSDSGHGIGWQVEGGLAIPLNEKWMLMPGLRYRSLRRNLRIENVTSSVDLNYLSAGLGIAVKF